MSTLDPAAGERIVVKVGSSSISGERRAQIEPLVDALARLHAQGRSSLGEGTRLVGSFRAHGLTVPVWDLPSEVRAEDVEKPAAEFAERLAAALAVEEPLTAEERRARGGLTNRQVTLS